MLMHNDNQADLLKQILKEQQIANRRYGFFRFIVSTASFLSFLVFLLFTYNFFILHPERLSLAYLNAVANRAYHALEDTFFVMDAHLNEAFFAELDQQVNVAYYNYDTDQYETATIPPAPLSYDFASIGAFPFVSQNDAKRLRLKPYQYKNAKRITHTLATFKPQPFFAGFCLATAMHESSFRNIKEHKATASKSKEKAGDIGRGFYQFTSPALKARYHVNPMDITSATKGCLNYANDMHRYWMSQGYKPYSPSILRVMAMEYNGGRRNALNATRSRNYRGMKRYAAATLRFYRMFTDKI